MKNKAPHRDRGPQKPSDRGRSRPYAKQSKKLRLQADLWGTHAVSEAWMNPARQIRQLYITETMLAAFADTRAAADKAGLKRPEPTLIDKKDLDRALDGAVHQGIALTCKPLDEVFVQDLVARSAAKERSVLLMLDQVTDPHNVGAIIRSACAFGADGIIMQRKHSPALTGILAKTACGGVEHLPAAYEINLSDTLDYLRNKGYSAIGLDERGEHVIGAAANGSRKTVLVLGAEGKGLRPKIREHCDTLVRLQTAGPIASLNVSNAAAVALYSFCEQAM
ncbi:MAG: 23S rRNA (guanosine(2251)-2'-O)-methyltransferase RlmB [Rhodospirillales bacterium]|nr:23S rRNA (guanosine(2251)-2'-O)-methyltransferase RlmB [Rhodospirillales bacterium]MCB9996767.1 23S rRNA (guanosine(2251)-2'-O)-methyltransferase RlmB [Rhodospirillales bacterium]